MDQIARADSCPALSPPQSHRSWNLFWLATAIIAAQFLPDRHYSRFSIIPFIAVAIVAVSTGLLMRSRVRSGEPTLAWNVVRWYAVLSLTLVAYVVGMRLAFPIQPWAGAFNSVLQHRLNHFTSFPLLALCLAGVILLISSRTARRSPLFWLTAGLAVTITWSLAVRLGTSYRIGRLYIPFS